MLVALFATSRLSIAAAPARSIARPEDPQACFHLRYLVSTAQLRVTWQESSDRGLEPCFVRSPSCVQRKYGRASLRTSLELVMDTLLGDVADNPGCWESSKCSVDVVGHPPNSCPRPYSESAVPSLSRARGMRI